MMEIAPKIAFHGNNFEPLIFFLALMCHLLVSVEYYKKSNTPEDNAQVVPIVI